MAFTDVWDVTQPLDTEEASLLGQNLRNLKLDIQQRMSAISGISTNLPPIGSDAQPTNWTGLLCFATDNGHVYQWSGTAWVDITASILSPEYIDTTILNITGTTPGATIPASSLYVGAIIEVDFAFAATAASSGNSFVMSLQLNGTTIASGSLSNPFGGIARFRMFCTVLGTSGQVINQLQFPTYMNLTTPYGNNADAAPLTVNTTAALVFSLSLTLNGTAAGSVGPLNVSVS